MRVSWNYRVLRHADGTVAVHEVYYDNGSPVSCTEKPDALYERDLDALRRTVAAVTRALDEPVLEYDSFSAAGAK